MVKEVIPLGFMMDPLLQRDLYYIFLIVYISSLLGNITLISLICADSWLHAPMYFFTGIFSFLDLWYVSVYVPKILMTCISDDKSISFAGCLAQFFFSAWLAYTECYLLAAMAYDDVAISNPLLYSQAMSPRLCVSLVAASYFSGFVNSTIVTSETFTLSFWGNNVIDDFFCDLSPLSSWPVMCRKATRLCCISYLPPTSSLPLCLSLPSVFSSLLPSWSSAPPKAA